MIHDRLARQPRRLEDFDIEQQHGGQDQHVSGAHRHAPAREQRNVEQRRAEFQAQQERDHIVEGKRDDQQREGDQIHRRAPASRLPGSNLRKGRDKLPALSPQQRYASLRGLSTWRPLYMPVLKSMWWGRRSSPESLSST